MGSSRAAKGVVFGSDGYGTLGFTVAMNHSIRSDETRVSCLQELETELECGLALHVVL